MNRSIKAIIVGLMLAGATAAFAHTGATGIVKERMDAMKSIGDEMKIVGGMFRGKIEFDGKRLEQAAEVIAGHGAKIEALFPKGSDHKPTRALAMVWKDKAEFDELGKKLVLAANALGLKAGKAQSGADIKMELIALGANCKACHEKFRAPKE